MEQERKHRRTHRRRARARLFHAARKRAFRDHPFVCWTSCLLISAGFVILFTHGCIATIRYRTAIPWLQWTSIGMIGLPQIWLAVALRLGPFSPKRKSRALFWQGVRWASLVIAASASVRVLLVSVAIVYAARKLAPLLGQRIPEYIWTGLWGREGHGGMIWYYAAHLIGIIVLVFIASRLKLMIRRLEGRCVRCDYSLRGLVEARCPECGTPFNAADLESLRPKSAYAKDDA